MVNTTAIQLRHDTAANWTADNPTLAAGEMGLETDTNRFKFGDGSTAWDTLPYVGAGASFKYGKYTMPANQTSNLGNGNHVEWDTTEGSLGGLSTGTGQQLGIITLPAGKTYKITCSLMLLFSAAQSVTASIYDRTNNVYLGQALIAYANNANTLYTPQPTLVTVVTPETNIDIDVRFMNIASASFVHNISWLLIEEYGGY